MNISNWVIFALAFYIGFASMAIEIMAGKMMAIYFGGAIYVWGGVIGVVLVGISLGYYVGGHLADTFAKKTIQYSLLSIILFLLLIPLLDSYVIFVFKQFSKMIGLLGSLFLLFLLPPLLLAMIPPCLLKLYAKDLNKIGKSGGNLYAASSIGSILGVFLTSFLLVFVLPTTLVFYILALFFAFFVFILVDRKYVGVVVILLVILILISTTADMYSFPEEEPIDNATIEKMSSYGMVSIYESVFFKSLAVNGGVMGGMDKRDIYALEDDSYLRCMVREVKENESVLVLGIGAGILPRYLPYHLNVSVDAVDVNPVVIELVQEHFNLTQHEKLNIINKDARVYLEESNKKYDHILMDISQVDINHILPQHLTTQEYFALVAEDLKPTGTFALNTIVEDWENSTLAKRFASTVAVAFENTFIQDNCYFTVVIASQERRLICEDDVACTPANTSISPATDELIGYIPYLN